MASLKLLAAFRTLLLGSGVLCLLLRFVCCLLLSGQALPPPLPCLYAPNLDGLTAALTLKYQQANQRQPGGTGPACQPISCAPAA